MEGALPSSRMRKNGMMQPGTPRSPRSSAEAELMTCDATVPYLALVDFEALAGIEQRVKDLSLQMCRPQECHPEKIARNHWTGFTFNAGQQKHQDTP